MSPADSDRPRLAALPPACHLCGEPADQGPAVILRPASGTTRPVGLCEPCRSGRPARDEPEVGPADIAWYVLTRDVSALQHRYDSELWHPSMAELEFAETLARLHWTEESIRSAERAAPPGTGPLALLVDNAAFVLRYADARDTALLPLRRLVDVLADDAERQLPPATAPEPFREIHVQTTDLHEGPFVEPMRPFHAHAYGTVAVPPDVYAGSGRHRRPKDQGSGSASPADEPEPPARHRRPRADDPVPEGVTSLWEWRFRPPAPHPGPGA
ncbi:hypothetical protein [Streptomyces geranii]|uniref:hypothetical protein n=1 Tax=Streptomyces geranii TaxID=2058923 RepID=UPI00130054F2|nr:hypothetical protein [Streptomyces geranii]